MKQRAGYRLQVPLDASSVQDFKPDRAVKVVAFDTKGRAYEDSSSSTAKGQGTASLAIEEHARKPSRGRWPGECICRTAKRSADHRRGCRPPAMGRARQELTLSPIVISHYYWWWWIRWCRRFKISGVVRCANGDPVPGAKVCAYDVDWWWWWSSKQQVGCATTDVNGSFEIDFTGVADGGPGGGGSSAMVPGTAFGGTHQPPAPAGIEANEDSALRRLSPTLPSSRALLGRPQRPRPDARSTLLEPCQPA